MKGMPALEERVDSSAKCNFLKQTFFLYFIDIYISLQIRVTITIEITFADKKKEKPDKLT